MKILICPLFWDGDRDDMEEVVRLSSDLLEKPSNHVELLAVNRFDARPLSDRTLRHAGEKFDKVGTWTCDRKGLGHPWGCNELAFGILNHLCIARDRFMHLDAVLLLESDCVFLHRDWDVQLVEEWRQTQAAGKMITGAEIPGGHMYSSHINAAALYRRDAANELKLYGCPHDVGWDYALGQVTVPVARASTRFVLDYRRQSITRQDLFKDPNVLMYHGVRDHSARQAVRDHFEL